MAQGLNEPALRSWMAKLGPRLIHLSAGICRDRHQAEEVVQEAFVKLWHSPPDAGEIAIPSWLRRVVTNLSINALQRTRRPANLPASASDPALDTHDRPEAAITMREKMSRLSEAMDRLDPAKRALLMLRAHQQLSYEEIAEHLGVPIGTVMSRLNRARLALMDEMEQGGRRSQEAPSVYPFEKYKQA